MSAFDTPYAHGMVRVAAFSPRVTPADPKANLDAMRPLLARADAESAALCLFPELGLTGYAIDDLHLQARLLDAAETAARALVTESRALRPVILAGAPVRIAGQVFNCALVIHRGALLGVVPKSYLPNYREFYEKRWFSAAPGAPRTEVRFAGETAPFGTDLIFEASDDPRFRLGVEVCEDLWAAIPPSTRLALSGATVIANLSASNATIGKARDRAAICADQSRRTQSAYLFSAAGPGESTTDLAWDGQLTLHELGALTAQSGRFQEAEPAALIADIDLERIEQDRLRTSTFRDAAEREAAPVRRVGFTLAPPLETALPLRRDVSPYPFVPADAERLDEDCYEAWSIQVQGLTQRLRASGVAKAVIGVSGGLDSTQALIVAARAFDALDRPRSDILALTLPGFATSDETRDNAVALIKAIGATHREIDIRPAAERMLQDIGHPYADGAADYDVTFENVQAGLRTDYLFRVANHEGGLVVGTGDLSELALGWCTYGVGDQMAHYNVNASVAKTLIKHLIHWAASREALGAGASEILERILATEISPELVPAGADGAIQSTEAAIGPYVLHDFFLHHAARFGLGPRKIAYLAVHAFARARTEGPQAHPAYDAETILKWLEVFAKRFYATAQFKRSAMPNGPKVTSAGALSPRGDWRAPSDASARVWLDEIAALRAELGL